MRIIYVEDNPANVGLMERLAMIGKHQIKSYDSAEEALKHISQDSADLILVDVQLRGGMDGLELTRRLRAAGLSLPIIAITAYAMITDREQCLDAGCSDYIPKPISLRGLLDKIAEYETARP
ncbi:MAG: response regulator [Anaerolineae bacterium]|nr:response regulator [Anaerolineae bacterium]